MWPWCSGELRRESTAYRRLELGGYEEGSVVSDLRGSTNGGTTIKWGVDERSTRNIDLNDYTARSPAAPTDCTRRRQASWSLCCFLPTARTMTLQDMMRL